MYLHYRVKTSSLDSPIRLQVVYIADSLAGYCYKKQPEVTLAIGRYVPKFYAYAYEAQIEGVREKLAKLLKYWEKGYPFQDKCLQVSFYLEYIVYVVFSSSLEIQRKS